MHIIEHQHGGSRGFGIAIEPHVKRQWEKHIVEDMMKGGWSSAEGKPRPADESVVGNLQIQRLEIFPAALDVRHPLGDCRLK